MSLDITIYYKEPRQANYFLDHPYSYDYLTEGDKAYYSLESCWDANITHNLGEMADHIPIDLKGIKTTLYYVCWRPEEIGVKTVGDILPLLVQGIHYMIDHRLELKQYDSPNGWGTYNGFMKFLLNYKQACEDNDQDCIIEADR